MATRGAPNDRLRRARGARTQAELAESANGAIYRATGRVGTLTAKAISDLECGLYTWPAKQTRDALCAVLGVPDARDLGFAPRRRSRAARPFPLPSMAVATVPGRPPDVATIRAVSSSLQAADRQLGGGHLYPSVVGYLRSQIAPALTLAVADHDSADLFAAAASFSEIAGWMSHDGGDDRRADRHFTQALRLARAADRPDVVGNVQASLSHLSVHVGRSRDAVQLAEDGVTHARSHHPLVARLQAMRARGLAALGDARDSRAALADAERALARTGGGRGEWISHFDAAALASETAWCLHRLGDLDAAERTARAAIVLRSGERVRSRTFAQLGLAQVLLAANRVDEAVQLAEQVRSTAVTLTSARVRTQLVELAAALSAHRSVPLVARFLDSMVGITAGPTLIEEPV